jgi:hypothetical protein
VVAAAPPPGAPWQAVILDRAFAPSTDLERALLEARDRLAPAGGLWLFERYESLEESAAEAARDPLARLRQLLAASGLRCERIQPLETDGVHLLATFSRRSGARSDRSVEDRLREDVARGPGFPHPLAPRASLR